jgi:hypothetical protein
MKLTYLCNAAHLSMSTIDIVSCYEWDQSIGCHSTRLPRLRYHFLSLLRSQISVKSSSIVRVVSIINSIYN